MIVQASRDNRRLWRTMGHMPVYSFVPVLPISDIEPERTVLRGENLPGSIKPVFWSAARGSWKKWRDALLSLFLLAGGIFLSAEVFYQRTARVLGEHPRFPLLIILQFGRCSAVLRRSTSLEENQKDENYSHVQRTLWTESGARENHGTL
jgi:hypothetical protein